MNILFIGDISGRPGRHTVRDILPELKKQRKVDFVIANCENAAGGRGVTRKILTELQGYGVDFFTTGEHVWDQSEFKDDLYDDNLPITRPANYERNELIPGSGWKKYDLGKLGSLVVINLIGQTFMRSDARNPFWYVEDLLNQNKNDWENSAIVVDFHAEATSEKLAMGYHLKDKVTAMVGTHTHVSTADHRLFGNTGYVTDVGMVGPYDASLWVQFENVLHNFKFPFKQQFEVEMEGKRIFNSVLLDIEENTTDFGIKKCKKIERLDRVVN